MIPEILKPETLQEFVKDVEPDPDFYWSNQFPEKDYPEEIIRWQVYTGDKGMAPIIDRGAQSPKWRGGGIHEVLMRGFFISEKMDHTEEDINRCLVKDPIKKQAAEALILDEVDELQNRARRTREYLASQLMFNQGVISYADKHGMTLDVDYNLPSDLHISDLGTNKEWGTGSSRDAASDCYSMKRKIAQRAGSAVTSVFMNSNTLTKRLMADTKIQTALRKDAYGVGGKETLWTKPVETLTWYLDIPIRVYDLTMPLTVNITGRTDASNYTLEDVTKLKVGSEIAFYKVTNSEIQDEHWTTITAIDSDTGVVTLNDATTTTYVPGRDLVQVEVPFLDDDYVVFVAEKVKGKPIMDWYNSPVGLGASKFGLRVETWENKDPDLVVTRAQWMGLWALKYPKAIGSIYVG